MEARGRASASGTRATMTGPSRRAAGSSPMYSVAASSSSLIADGGTGKTALRVRSSAIAGDRPTLDRRARVPALPRAHRLLRRRSRRATAAGQGGEDATWHLTRAR